MPGASKYFRKKIVRGRDKTREHALQHVIDGFERSDREHDEHDAHHETAANGMTEGVVERRAHEEKTRHRDNQAQRHHDGAEELVVVAPVFVDRQEASERLPVHDGRDQLDEARDRETVRERTKVGLRQIPDDQHLSCAGEQQREDSTAKKDARAPNVLDVERRDLACALGILPGRRVVLVH